ncbi:MAG: MBL fold metallo-hydrolase [Gammaproteobacteria bacterium]
MILITACQHASNVSNKSEERQARFSSRTVKDNDLNGSKFITLGTAGGPLLEVNRSQPANALVTEGGVYLVDAGDGAGGQLAKAGYSLQSVDAVFISHLHFDHTGGLPAILGLRHQTNSPKTLTIYGPPGIKESVEGIFAFMAPEMRVGFAVPGARRSHSRPQDKTVVIELIPGDPVNVNNMQVTAVENTHFTFPRGSDAARLNKSFAYRFDLPDRSIVYTGDTGPSSSVVQLAKGADLLVSEMMDIPYTIKNIKRNNAKRAKQSPPAVLEGVFKHLRTHHVTPQQVGEMAAKAGVKSVVVTHFAGKDDRQSLDDYRDLIELEFNGDVAIATDLQIF